MARGPATFKQADVARAVRAVESAGLKVVRTEIGPDGRIVLHHDSAPAALTPFDEWKAKQNAN